jgi:hypothetical protein
MSKNTKIFFTEQAKLSQLTLNQLNTLLLNGESTIYVDSDNILRIAEKNNNITTQKNAVGDTIKSTNVGDLPIKFPPPDTGYSLMAVRDGSNYKLIWGWMNTIGDYNVITGNTTYTIVTTNPTSQIFNTNTPGNYSFNGDISITVNGDGAFVAKKYSIDGGSTFSALNSTPNFFYQELGSISGETYNLVIKDEAEVVIHTETINLLPPDYSFELINVALYTPNIISHVIYKTYDINQVIGSQLEIVVEEGNTLLPGLYHYQVFNSSNTLIVESNGFIADKKFTVTTPVDDTYRAEVSRINSGYIELGKWESPTSSINYFPKDFLWSKDNGQTFSIASSNIQPFILQNNNNSIRINYAVNEIGEVGGVKKIYMRLNNTNTIYQSTHQLLQVNLPSNPINQDVKVDDFKGNVEDVLFGTPFNSDLYDKPVVITQGNPFWGGNDFNFSVQFLSSAFIGSPVELFMLIEDLRGNLITQKIQSTLVASNPSIGMVFDFNITDFQSIVSPYFGQILRTRFILDPDITSQNPINFISSNLKFVLYV